MNPLQSILVCCFLLASKTYSYSQNANEIIGNYFKAIGGYEKKYSVQTFSSEGIRIYDGIASSIKITIDEGKLWREDYNTEKERKFLLLTKDGGWEYSKKKLNKLQDSLAGKHQNTYFLESALSLYSQPGFNAAYLGNDSADEKLCYKIQVLANTDDSLYCWFDTSTNLLIKTSTKTSAGFRQRKGIIKDIPIYKNTIYHDYKNTGGLLYPFTYLNEGVEIASGRIIRKINFYATKIEINKPIDERLYKPE